MAFLAIVWGRDATAVRTIKAIMDESPDGIELVGVFDFPNRAELKCTGFCGPHRRASGWSRDRRGYVICGNCGGRHKRTRQRLVSSLFDYLGANLYRKAPALFRTPEDYGPRT